MHTERLAFLLDRFLENSISTAEMQELRACLEAEGDGERVHEILAAMIEREGEVGDYQPQQYDPLVDKVLRKRRNVFMMVRRAAAAAIILLLAGGTAWWGIRKSTQQVAPIAQARKAAASGDIPPGGNRATLTLADNSTIDLDGAREGVLSRQGSQQVVKRKDGQLAYQPIGRRQTGSTVTYNLLTTPRGGQYQLILPDGSKVWLNAASSIRYPTSFTGDQRLVELKGEAYFEVAQNPSMPFRVAVAGRSEEPVRVDVLGTSFNIKAYPDESAISTTLLNGSVRVSDGKGTAMLHPGEKAACRVGEAIRVGATDVEEAVAWKNGLFNFNGATIDEVMRQLSRWYDVDVQYENGIPKDQFQGEFYRNVNVSQVLKVLQAGGLNFSVSGKTIIVK